MTLAKKTKNQKPKASKNKTQKIQTKSKTFKKNIYSVQDEQIREAVKEAY